MSLYVRQLAWLNTGWVDDDGRQNIPRIAKYQTEGEALPLPPVDFRFDLINKLLDMGTVSTSGMGYSPLPFAEIKCWSELRQEYLTPWEVSVIRRLSGDYVVTQRAAEKNIPPPYAINEITDEDVEVAFKRGLEMFQSVHKARKK